MISKNDKVFWRDPDEGLSSGIYTIKSTNNKNSWINNGTEVPNYELIKLGDKIKNNNDLDEGQTVFFYDKKDLNNSGEVIIHEIISPNLVVVSSEEVMALFEIRVDSIYKLGD